MTVLQLDVTDTASVEACVSEVIKREGKIDVLVNNAGVGFVRTTEQATEEDIKVRASKSSFNRGCIFVESVLGSGKKSPAAVRAT